MTGGQPLFIAGAFALGEQLRPISQGPAGNRTAPRRRCEWRAVDIVAAAKMDDL